MVEPSEEHKDASRAKGTPNIPPPQITPTLKFSAHPISQAYQQSEYVDPNQLQRALAAKPLGTFLTVRFPERYVRETIEPIAQKLRRLHDLISKTHKRNQRASYYAESQQWHHMEQLLEVLGPYKFISYVLAHTRGAYAQSKPFYQHRIFRRKCEATQFQHPVKKDGVRSVVPHALKLLGLPTDTRDHNKALARIKEFSRLGIFDITPHPKEALIVDLLSNAPQLSRGGRVLLVCNNRDQMEHLKILLERHPRVSHLVDFEEILGSSEHFAHATSEEHAFSSPSRRVEVFTATAHQLVQLKSKHSTAKIRAALFLAYDSGTMQFTKKDNRIIRERVPPGIPATFRYQPQTRQTFPKDTYPTIVTSKALVLDTTGSKTEINVLYPLERAQPNQARFPW